MTEQDKGSKDIGLEIEFKEGERGPLSCNKANVRSPSLDFISGDSPTFEQTQNCILTPKTIDIFSAFAVTLKRIHIRLIAEGYIIKDGQIIKSERLKSYEKDNKPNRKNK